MGGYKGAARDRWSPEPDKAARLPRSEFERDRARVLHSSALRRLAGKTQVVGVGEDDFPRTRLTHSLECAQIGRELGAALGADPDLVDAACLAHDLGHPPFGHNGEAALHVAAESCGGFEGNAQSLRVLTRLEAKVEGAGLNLTRATLDAATKYPWPRRAGRRKFGVYDDDRAVFTWLRDGAPAERRCLEAQVMDWADDVAYSVHDVEDGVVAGHVPLDRLDVDAVVAIAACECGDAGLAEVAGEADLRALLAGLRAQPWWVGDFDGSRRGQVALKRMASELIARFTAAALRATRARHGDGPLRRYAADLVVPARARTECELLKAVAAHHVMRGRAQLQERQREVVGELVSALLSRAPDEISPALRPAWDAASDDAGRLRVVVDQVASLTDASALASHARLLGSPP